MGHIGIHFWLFWGHGGQWGSGGLVLSNIFSPHLEELMRDGKFGCGSNLGLHDTTLVISLRKLHLVNNINYALKIYREIVFFTIIGLKSSTHESPRLVFFFLAISFR